MVRDGLSTRLSDTEHIQVIGEASSGEQALQLATLLKPDIALIDIGMPGMNGIELTQRLLQQLPTIKVLILSMYDSHKYVLSATQAGAHGYIQKDAPAQEIIAAISIIKAGSSYFCDKSQRLLADASFASEKLDTLTEREKEVLLLIAEGHVNKDIARQLQISVRTVEVHRTNLRHKLGIMTAAGLAHFAHQQGLYP